MNVFIETKRLIIKKPSLADLGDLHGLVTDPDVMQYMRIQPRNQEEVKQWLQKSIDHDDQHGFGLGSVFEKQTNTFIGRAGLIYLAYDSTQPDVEIAYALHKEHWGKGYATELASAIIEWGFSHIEINQLVAVANPANTKSRQVLEKVGMQSMGKTLYHHFEMVRYEIQRNMFIREA